jgi:alpha-methylacyl-CoA racemase
MDRSAWTFGRITNPPLRRSRGLSHGYVCGSHHGASIIRIDRPSSSLNDTLCEGKRSITLDTKNPAGLAIAKRLIAQADVLIDPFRPGVLERLGLGPEVFHDTDGKKGLNDRLIYARLAG